MACLAGPFGQGVYGRRPYIHNNPFHWAPQWIHRGIQQTAQPVPHILLVLLHAVPRHLPPCAHGCQQLVVFFLSCVNTTLSDVSLSSSHGLLQADTVVPTRTRRAYGFLNQVTGCLACGRRFRRSASSLLRYLHESHSLSPH